MNPTLKNPKHASVLQENSISYDHPLNPMQVAEIRAQRIQREKKQNQQQQQANAAVSLTCSIGLKNESKFVNIFLPINLNICFGCSKELSHLDGSFEYPQHMFWLRNFQLGSSLEACYSNAGGGDPSPENTERE